MTTCPNCGHKINDMDDICPNCGFNLKKYRDDFSPINIKRLSTKSPMKLKKLPVVQHIVKNFIQKNKIQPFNE